MMKRMEPTITLKVHALLAEQHGQTAILMHAAKYDPRFKTRAVDALDTLHRMIERLIAPGSGGEKWDKRHV